MRRRAFTVIEIIVIIAIIAILAAILFPVLAARKADPLPSSSAPSATLNDSYNYLLASTSADPALMTAFTTSNTPNLAFGSPTGPTMMLASYGTAGAAVQGGGFAGWVRAVIAWIRDHLGPIFARWRDAVLGFLRNLSISFRIESNSSQYCRSRGFMIFRGPWTCEMWSNGSFDFRFGN